MNRLQDVSFQPPPSDTAIDHLKPQTVWVGIDPGETTGLAIYSKELGLLIFQTSFWDTIAFIQEKMEPAMKAGTHTFDVVIEAPQFNPFSYARHTAGKGMGEALKIARNVGMNQGDAKRTTQYLRRCGIEPKEYIPTPKAQKWTPEYFKILSGIDTLKTHDHSRDAARMIAHAWAGKINKA